MTQHEKAAEDKKGRPKFWPGQLVATAGIAEHIKAGWNPAQYLRRHIMGDWGDLEGDHDAQANEQALKDGGRLFSSYRDKRLGEIWIITEADKSVTTIMLPEEY